MSAYIYDVDKFELILSSNGGSNSARVFASRCKLNIYLKIKSN